MLAEMPSAPHDVPLREHSHLDLHQDGREIIDSNQGIEDRVCPGCKTPAVKENGGLVVAFGYVAPSFVVAQSNRGRIGPTYLHGLVTPSIVTYNPVVC